MAGAPGCGASRETCPRLSREPSPVPPSPPPPAPGAVLPPGQPRLASGAAPRSPGWPEGGSAASQRSRQQSGGRALPAGRRGGWNAPSRGGLPDGPVAPNHPPHTHTPRGPPRSCLKLELDDLPGACHLRSLRGAVRLAELSSSQAASRPSAGTVPTGLGSSLALRGPPRGVGLRHQPPACATCWANRSSVGVRHRGCGLARQEWVYSSKAWYVISTGGGSTGQGEGTRPLSKDLKGQGGPAVTLQLPRVTSSDRHEILDAENGAMSRERDVHIPSACTQRKKAWLRNPAAPYSAKLQRFLKPTADFNSCHPA
ncbi:translation initiation factor IF-2-like [Apus apus]|uniref:translation initiation factor IF-2-like n=1 Tax=Apus apus TaxID=8895 RepID=UPI0021F90987|nr:translation initiation factor IF-2-like [Apus apus]